MDRTRFSHFPGCERLSGILYQESQNIQYIHKSDSLVDLPYDHRIDETMIDSSLFLFLFRVVSSTWESMTGALDILACPSFSRAFATVSELEMVTSC